MDRKTLAAIVVVVLVVAGAGYLLLQPTAPGVPEVPREETLIIMTIGEPDYLDPHVDYETAGGEVIAQIYELLFWYNGTDIAPIPWLAKNYTASENGTVYIITLRQGINFTSGNPFNATAVKYSLDRAILMTAAEPNGPGWILCQSIKGGPEFMSFVYNPSLYPASKGLTLWAMYRYLFNSGVKIINESAVMIILDHPYAPFISTLTYYVAAIVDPWSIGNEDDPLLSEVVTTSSETYMVDGVTYTVSSPVFKVNDAIIGDDGTVPMHEDMNEGRLMVGTGAYKMVEWRHGEYIIMDRNDDYWGGPPEYVAGGKVTPYFKRIMIKYVDEYTTRKNALLAGDADIIYWPTVYASELMNKTPERPEDIVPGLQEVKDELAADVRLIAGYPTFDVMFFAFNVNETLEGKPNPFKYRGVREGFSYAFDYYGFLNTTVSNFAVKLVGPIPKGMFGNWVDVVNGTPPSAEYADEYSDPDIVSLAQSIEPLFPTFNITKAKEILSQFYWSEENKTITLYYNEGNEVRKYGCMMLEQNIESLGLDIDIIVQALSWPEYLDKLRSKTLPIFFLGWAPDYIDPDDYAFPFAHSTGTYPSRIFYKNETVDAWVEEAATTLNTTRRLELYLLIQKQLISDYVYIWLYQGMNFHVERTWIRGYYFTPATFLWFAYLSRVSE
ncbi:MAG: ABC transporter substrate-binding protein [Candidatus Asgardarchaeia archaeon]